MSTEKNEYNPCVRFYAEKSEADNCICIGCHNIGQVMKLSLPETLYRKPKYNKPETLYSTYWFCKDCMRKLLYTISDAERRAEKEETPHGTSCGHRA